MNLPQTRGSATPPSAPSRKPCLLLVDDQPLNTSLLQEQLGGAEFQFMTANSGLEAMALLAQQLPDMVICDLRMPGMDGIEVANRIKKDVRTQHLPIIMLTVDGNPASRLRALHAGVEEFVLKPVERAELKARVRNLLRLKEYHDALDSHNQALVGQLANRTQQLTDAYRETIYTMVKAAEFKDEDTGAHVQRISFYCLEMAEQLGLDENFRDQIFYASPMHDIGKIGIPDAILLKTSSFEPEEWEVMQTHCEIGARILRKGQSPYMRMATDIALCHHEHWDGSGYPNKTRGEDIPLAARITTICDQYDALRSKRPYKQPRSHDDVVRILVEGDGRSLPSHFDPAVLAAFRAVARRFDDIYESNR